MERAESGSRSEEHTSELQSHSEISYAVFCLKKKNQRAPVYREGEQVGTLQSDTIVEHFNCMLGDDVERRFGLVFFFNDTATTEIYTNLITLSLHDALPISFAWSFSWAGPGSTSDTTGRFGSSPRRKRSEEHTSELQSHSETSYAVYCS